MSAAGRAQPATNAPVLRVRDLTVRFDSGHNVVHAVTGVSFDLDPLIGGLPPGKP